MGESGRSADSSLRSVDYESLPPFKHSSVGIARAGVSSLAAEQRAMERRRRIAAPYAECCLCEEIHGDSGA